MISFFKKDLTLLLFANILYSFSSFLINMSLPKILSQDVFSDFIYTYQMVLFLTNVTQFGFVMALYYYMNERKEETINIFYFLIVILVFFILGISTCDNCIYDYLKLDIHSYNEKIAFALAISVSGIYLFNKGVNIKEKAFKYMLVISIAAFISRLLLIFIIPILNIKSTTILLLILFILPFLIDIKDFCYRSLKHIRPSQISKSNFCHFFFFSTKVWLTSIFFLLSERLFLIKTKGLDGEITTAIAFATGFTGIIYIFKTTFYNYYLAKFSINNITEIKSYLHKLLRYGGVYFTFVILIATFISFFVFYFYDCFTILTSKVVFILLLQTGIICYIGMITLLSKTLNYLNKEIALNIMRLISIYMLCEYPITNDIFTWYITVIFTLMIPELLMSSFIIWKIYYNDAR